MKILKCLLICFVIVTFLESKIQEDISLLLESFKPQTETEKQQMENSIAFATLLDPWQDAALEYFKKNNTDDIVIKCKHCDDGELCLGFFNGCLMAEFAKAVAAKRDEFERIKKIVAEFSNLFSSNASSKKLINFMLKTSNDGIKQPCPQCDCVGWKKMAE
jgi:hypothetical protein